MDIKVFISQPMNGRSNEEIEKERQEIIKELKEKYFDMNVIILDSFFINSPHDAKPLWFLAKSLELLSTADVAYFAKGYEKARGCKIEYECAIAYDILTITPNEDKEKLITKWLIDNVFRNDDYYTLHDEETTNELLLNLMEIIASLHNEYYKAIHGKYYDYMFHWVNKMNAGSIIDDIFKKFK